MKYWTIILVFSLTLATAKASIAAVLLQSSVTVDTPGLFLGNIFHGLSSEKANLKIGNAPEPGERKKLRVSIIQKIAKRYGIDWQPTPTTTPAIIIKRASRPLMLDDFRLELSDALEASGIEGDFSVFLKRRNLSSFVPINEPFEVNITSIHFEEKSERFYANININGKNFTPFNTNISGFARRMVEIPVLNKTLKQGDGITQNEIKWIKIPEKKVPLDIIIDPSELIGKEASRGLRNGKAIRLIDVRNRRLVKKGKTVTITLKTPLMTLKTVGESLEHGSRGELIRVLNLRSKKTITAIVVGRNDVHIPHINSIEIAASK